MNWATAKSPRHQADMIGVSLDERLAPDANIRALDSLLDEIDWTQWERLYARLRGHPPIHPKLVAGTILFGMMRGAFTSRKLEEATGEWLSLNWFLEGRTIDHATFCAFRRKFHDLLPDLFDQVARIAAGPRKALRNIAVDGTTIRADSDRHGARTAESLRQRIAAIAQQSEELFARMEQNDLLDDIEEAELGDAVVKPDEATLRRQLEALDKQRAKLEAALAIADERDAIKCASDGPKATATRVPVTDPDATLLLNKDGGFAPNYTAVAAVDVDTGAIISAQIADGKDEAGTLTGVVEQCEKLDGAKPDNLLCDGGFSTGPALKQLEEDGVTALSPSAPPVDPSVARDDLTRPVADNQLDEIPTQGKGEKKYFSRAAFIYDAETDTYYCPAGAPLRRCQSGQHRSKNGATYRRQRYLCNACADCSLRARCTKSKRGRTLSRDEHQPYRDNLAQRMSEEANGKLYKKRAPVAEGVFGQIKSTMGFRRFNRRGRDAVQGEWLLLCSAYNIGKILRQRHGAGTSAPASPPRVDGRPPNGSGKSILGHIQSAIRQIAENSHRLSQTFALGALSRYISGQRTADVS